MAIRIVGEHADMIRMVCRATKWERGGAFIGRTRFCYNEDDQLVYALCANNNDPIFFRSKNSITIETIGFHFLTVGSVSEKLGSYDDFMALSGIQKVVTQMIAIIIYVYCTFLCSICNFVNAVMFRLDLLLMIQLGILILLACKVCLLMFLSALAFVRGFSQRFMWQKGCLGDFSTGRELSLLLLQFVLLDLLLVCPTSNLFLIGSI